MVTIVHEMLGGYTNIQGIGRCYAIETSSFLAGSRLPGRPSRRPCRLGEGTGHKTRAALGVGCGDGLSVAHRCRCIYNLPVRGRVCRKLVSQKKGWTLGAAERETADTYTIPTLYV